jgi:hypothetical protein
MQSQGGREARSLSGRTPRTLEPIEQEGRHLHRPKYVRRISFAERRRRIPYAGESGIQPDRSLAMNCSSRSVKAYCGVRGWVCIFVMGFAVGWDPNWYDGFGTVASKEDIGHRGERKRQRGCGRIIVLTSRLVDYS